LQQLYKKLSALWSRYIQIYKKAAVSALKSFMMGKFSFVFVLGFVLMISMQNIAVVVAQSCPAAERDALLAFKAGITEDPSGQLTT
jgi:hypothetical protein